MFQTPKCSQTQPNLTEEDLFTFYFRQISEEELQKKKRFVKPFFSINNKKKMQERLFIINIK